MILKKERFEDAYQKLVDKAYKHGDRVPSFRSGYWDQEEGYKYKYYDDARKEMDIDSWQDRRNDLDYIVGRASQPFWIITSGEKSLQNLVSSKNYNKVLDHVFSGSEIIKREAVDALYGLYYGADEKESFERLAKLMKGIPDPISIISMYFFLKDKSDGDFRYIIARKVGTTERLGKLGLQTACLKKCTWDGYMEYIDLLHQIQNYLRAYHPDATLLDAQSFLWMLHMI